MRKKPHLLILVLLPFAMGAVWWLLWPVAKQATDHPAVDVVASGPADRAVSYQLIEEGADRASLVSESALRKTLEQTLSSWLKHPPSRPEALAALARLKEMVHQTDPSLAAKALVALLGEGRDLPTGLGFVVGEEGVMDETPTFRTALIDLLGQTDPFLSADYARRVLGRTDSADEYALALRNLAWSGSQGGLADELRSAFRAMLLREDWMTKPTVGFLEAFDVAVEVGLVEELVRLIPPETNAAESPVARAAFIALDRLAVRQPSLVTAWLERHPSALAEAPSYRASLMSRLDVRDPAQTAVLARYLQRSDLSAEELRYFASVFPNGNFFTGHRLVTASLDVTDNMVARDYATLNTLSAWHKLPEFAADREALTAIVERLQATAAQ